MSENHEYSMFHELAEARMFKTKDQVQGEGVRMLADHLFVGLLSLWVMSNDYKYAPVAKAYAKRTTSLGNFNRPIPGGTDLYQTIYSLQRPELFTKERDTMLMDKIRMQTPKIRRFIQMAGMGKISTAEAQNLLFRLERDLKIQNPKLKAARRLAQNWENLGTSERKLVATQLHNYFRLYARRSDLMPLFGSFAKDENLLIPDGEKAGLAKRVIRNFAGGVAAGYAIGKQLPL